MDGCVHSIGHQKIGYQNAWHCTKLLVRDSGTSFWCGGLGSSVMGLTLVMLGHGLELGPVVWYFGTSVSTHQWAVPVTAAVHGISSRRCQLESKRLVSAERICPKSSSHILFVERMNIYKHQYELQGWYKERSESEWRVDLEGWTKPSVLIATCPATASPKSSSLLSRERWPTKLVYNRRNRSGLPVVTLDKPSCST